MQSPRSTVLALLLAAGLAGAGCQPTVNFPDRPAEQSVGPDGTRLIGYDTNGDGRVDYRQTADAAGQVVRLEFDDNHDGRMDETVELAGIDRSAVAHLVLILDGTPYGVVEEMWRQGHFRLFPPPSRTIGCFPAMTDLALNRLLHTGPSAGCEARYYDRTKNRVVGGTGNYLDASNSPWLARVDYRIDLLRDGDAYLSPGKLFRDELAGMDRVFARASGPGAVIGYTVATAGLATIGGERAVRDYLLTIDRYCQQIVHRRRGRVSLTLTADHGHSLLAGQRVSFKRYLEDRGWRVAASLAGDRDAVYIEYGLVSYAVFFTRSPARLADDLAAHQAADLVFYREGDSVIVRGDWGGGSMSVQCRARIEKAEAGYRYQPLAGDPLKLAPIIERLKAAGKVDASGVIDAEALFEATAEHEYPDPLARVWDAFNGLLTNPPDVIVSLKDPWYHGWPFFDFIIKEASTHGSLNRASSETFVLSTRAALPPLIRQERVMAAAGVTWDRPAGRSGRSGK